MTPQTDTPPARTPRNRLRAATLVALTTAVVAALLLGATTTANAATKHKTAQPFIAPTSVTLVEGVACTPHPDGTWDVTVRFKVTGGRYLNLGNPAEGRVDDRTHDNVYGGGTRYVTSTIHFMGHPGYADDHALSVASTFTYQQMVAPVTAQRYAVNLRSARVLTRDFEVTYTCL